MTVSKIAQTSLYPSTTQSVNYAGGNGSKDDFSQIFAAQSEENTSKDYAKTETTENNQVKENKGTEDATVEKATDETKDVETVEEKTEVSETKELQSTDEVEETDAETVDVETMEEAISEIMAAIRQILGVTEEELKAALEELGITADELLNTEMIPKVVVALTEGADELSIMTNEEVFSNVQELTAKVEEVLADLSKQLSMEQEELKQAFRNMVSTEVVEEPEEAQITVSRENETNIPVTEEVRVQTAVVEKESLAKADDNEQNASDSTHQQMTYAQTVEQRIEQAVAKVEATYSQTTTESIMNQIEDVIKVIQKENLTEMELQLHPASLGHVKVALAAKEGVITATFTAENETVRAALEAQMVTLKQSFEEHGIKVEAVEVTVASHAFERNLSGEGNGNTNDEASPNKKKNARRITLSDLNDEMITDELSDEDRIVAEMMKQNGNTVDYTV